MATIGNLRINVLANTLGFQRGMKRSSRQTQKFGRDVFRTSKRLVGFGAALAGVAGVGGLALFVRRTLDSVDATSKLSDRLGLAIEDLQAYQFAGRISGIQTESMNKSLETLVRRLGETVQGLGTARYALDALGLSSDRLLEVGTAEAFRIIAEEISHVETAAERSAIAYQLFGRHGSQLLKLFEEGRGGIERFEAEATRLGLTLNRVDAAKVEEANDAIERMKTATIGLGQALIVDLAPHIESIAKSFTEYALVADESGSGTSKAFELIEKGAKVASFAIDVLRIAFYALREEAVTQIAKTIDAVVSISGPLEFIFGEQIGFFTDGLRMEAEAARAAAEEIGRKLNNTTPDLKTIGTGEALAAVREHVIQLAEEERRAEEALAQAMISLNSDVLTLTDSLERQVATYGMSSRDAQLYELALRGATDEILEQARALDAQLDALERTTELQREAERVFEDTRTPLEAYEKELDKLNELLEEGLIDWDTYGRAVRKAREELEGVTSSAKEFAGPEAVSVRFLEEVDTNLSGGSQDDPLRAIELASDETVDQVRAANELGRERNDILRAIASTRSEVVSL